MGNIWSRSPEEDYERILSDFLNRISELEGQLASIRHLERRWAFWIFSYGSLLYMLTILYVFFYPRGPATIVYRPLLDGMALLGGPVALYWMRRLVGWIFGKRIKSLELRLREYRARQKRKLEELKQATSYYKTKGLIERFDLDEGKGGKGEKSTQLASNFPLGSSGEPSSVVPPNFQSNSFAPTAPSSSSCSSSSTSSLAFSSLPAHVPNGSSMVSPTPMFSPPPPCATPPTWIDRLVDAIIGDDRHSRYALVCPKCYAHNGLARPDDFEALQYVCPNCHHLNLPRRKQPPSIEDDKSVLYEDGSSEEAHQLSDAVEKKPMDDASEQVTPKQSTKRAAVIRRKTANNNRRDVTNA